MSEQFTIHYYSDCDPVINPRDTENVYLVLEGQVNIIAEERVYKKVLHIVKRTRKKRQKAAEEDPLGLDGSSAV